MTTKKMINKEEFFVEENEFVQVPHDEFNNLIILESLGIQERIISLLKEIALIGDFKLKCINITHGGFIPIKTSSSYREINVISTENQTINLLKNVKKFSIDNIICDFKNKNYDVLYIHNILINLEEDDNPSILVCNSSMNFKRENYISYILHDSTLSIHVSSKLNDSFLIEFSYYLEKDNVLKYDNLLHLSMIVKDAGDNFESILKENLPFIDRWTILDTGSTDNTINIINKVLVGQKKGQLYQEPFINFRDSRNRCLDLSGKECKFVIMLDDTYILKENITNFLVTVRGDQFSDSFSMFIKSNDSEYGSNRIIKSATKLRYKYKIHEVIDPVNNMNVVVPMEHAYIFDHRSEYMENRTIDRKSYDLKILYEMIEEEPHDSRALYYLGQTYNLLERYESAYEYFIKRIEHPDHGFIQERIDACFEAARISNFKLNKSWEECEKLYKRAYEMDISRPDSLYFLGIHYYIEKNHKLAYEYMKKAFEVGYPIHCQYSLKPTLSYYYLPKFLIELSYINNNIKLGKECSNLFLTKNKDDDSTEYYTVKCWDKIITHLLLLEKESSSIYLLKNKKPYLIFLADGGFNKWSGKDIENKGVGGSETFIIEMSKYIQLQGYFDVIVFCNCNYNEIYEGVEYRKISDYYSFIINNQIHTTIISRYPEYLPVSYKGNIENVYLILHDLIPNGEVIIRDEKLKNIICLTEWHCDVFKNMFQTLEDLVIPFGYGIDFKLFNKTLKKQKYKFIYSSFPNRGLLPLLEMWSRIYKKYPSAMLHIHTDLDGNWINSVRPDDIKKIKELLLEHPEGICYEGWTDKNKLAENWLTSDVWFYPCTFLETFCLTALESAITRTLIITNDAGALQNTVSDRGLIIKGDPTTKEWKEEALNKLFYILDEKNVDEKNYYINKSYDWAKNLSWEARANDFLKYILKDKYEVRNNNFNFENIMSYFNFKNNNKNYTTLEIGGIGIEMKSNTKIFQNDEEEYVILENNVKEKDINDLITIHLEKKKFDIIICSKMKLNDFDYYMLLVKCYSMLNKNGMIVLNKSDCLKEYMNKNKNLKMIEETNQICCLEKL